jgi:hypothetical protein
VFTDSHGYPSLHRRVGKNYDHVFFAVWDKRDLFANHPSAHFCPNFTDTKWFDGKTYQDDGNCLYEFGFFGSKGGLERANPMVEIAESNGWRATARQVAPGNKHQWPETALAMNRCTNLFNHSQKKDLNLRVFESMLMRRPLICDRNQRSGIDRLFEPHVHYIPYESHTYNGLEAAMKYVMINPENAEKIATNAYNLVKENHLVEHRVKQILEVVQ